MKKLKFITSKKGVISLFGVLVALISVIMLCGYLDLTQTTHVVEEIQSIMDITALSTLQGSVDAEGVRFDRMTIRSYEHFIPNPATGKSPADLQKVNSETDKDTLLTMLKADGELAKTTIWIDGTNANNVNQVTVRNILLKNYNYYLQKLLYTGTDGSSDPLLDYSSSNIGNTNEYNKESIIKKYEIREFNAELIYSSWGVDAEDKEGYQAIPQAYIDTTVILYLGVEPTFSSMNVSVEESHVYNALTSSNSSSKLQVEGYTDDGLLVVSIRTLARMTVQGFVSSNDTPDISDVTVSYDSLPYTPEEYFDITADGTVTGFSEKYYALPEADRPKAIKMPITIKGITPVKIGNQAFAGPDDKIVMMVLPASIKSIGTEAFAGATYLKDFGFMGTSQLTSMGEGAFKGCTALLHFVSPKGLTSIPASAFENCANMTAFSFSSALTTIGDDAFKNCTRLNGALNLPSSVTTVGSYAFYNCTSISSLQISKKLSNLGTSAFAKMLKLSTIKVESGNSNFVALENVLYQRLSDGTYALILYPATKAITTYTIPLVNSQLVTQIADYAFYGNKTLQEIYYNTDDVSEEKNMMHGIQKVGNNAFEKCSALKTLQFAGDLTDDAGNIIRKGLNSIGTDAFNATSSLSLVYIDKLKNTVSGSPWGANTDITTIRWKADDGFNWSKVYKYTADGEITGLTAYGAKLVLEEGLDLIIPDVIDDPYWGEVVITGIGNNAFSCRKEDAEYADANKKITKLEIVAQITYIGKNAFRGTSLSTFVLPDNVTTVGSYAFAESAITSFEIKETVDTTFGDGVFMSSALLDFKLTKNVVAMGSEMFKDCKELTNFTFESKIAEIPAYTFSGCKKLSSVVIPATVKVVGAYAFENCSVLNSIGDVQKIETVKTYAFTGCSTIAQFWFTENIKVIEQMAFFQATNLEQINLEVEEDSVLGAPWGAESYTNIVWLNSKWVKYYTYERYGTNMWRITGLSDVGIEALRTKALTDFQTPPQYLRENIISITFRDSDYTYLKNLTSMRFNISYKGGYELYPNVFANCTSLTDVTFPMGISKIGENAFKGCTSLKKIAVPSDVTSIGQSAFEGCTSMTLASLGTGTKVLQPYLFKGCTSLNQLILMGDVTTIGTKAFENCQSLPSFNILKSVSSIGDYAFQGCIALETVTSEAAPLTQINTGVFKDCTKLKTIALPEKVTTIKNNAFDNCIKLETIGNYSTSALTTIETKAFYGCSKLATLQSFPKLATIGESAFENSGVVTIQAQPSLTTIGKNAFLNSTVKTINTNPKLTTIGEAAFKGTNIVSLTSQPALTSIGESAFENCESMTQIGSQPKLTSISKSAFSGCRLLVQVAALDSVTTINEKAFAGCAELVEFPQINTLTTIKSQAFVACIGLDRITLGTSISNIANDAFSGCTALSKIYIKRSEYSDYQTNTSRVKNVSGTEAWGAPSTATVYWSNTLMVGQKNAYGSDVVCVEQKATLNAKTAKETKRVFFKYNGDTNDLTFTWENKAGLTSANVTFTEVDDEWYDFVFTKSTSDYLVWSLSDMYGNDGLIKFDVEDSIELSSDSITIKVPFTSTNSAVCISNGVGIYYSGDASTLTVTSSDKWLASSGILPVNMPKEYTVPSDADKAAHVTSGSYSGTATITVSDGTISETFSCKVEQSLKWDTPDSYTNELAYDSLRTIAFYYTGTCGGDTSRSLAKLTKNLTGSTNTSQGIGSGNGSIQGGSISTHFHTNVTLKTAGTLTISDGTASILKNLNWKDWWSPASNTVDGWNWSENIWISSGHISYYCTKLTYHGPYNSESNFMATVSGDKATAKYVPGSGVYVSITGPKGGGSQSIQDSISVFVSRKQIDGRSPCNSSWVEITLYKQ